MESFGKLLKLCRKRCWDSARERSLTQERLAELLGIESGVESLSGGTVSNWERGLNQIRRDDRHVLVGLIKVLHEGGGIGDLEAANKLLISGNYRPLDAREAAQVNLQWQSEDTSLGGYRLSVTEQEALLPAPSYSRLFGVELLVEEIVNHLKSSLTHLIVLTGIGGIGKTAVADAVARQAIRQNLFARVVWLSAVEILPDVTDKNNFFITSALCQRLLYENRIESNPANQLARLRFMLQRQPHLIVIDDLDASSPALLKELQELIGSGKCLLTAQQQPSIEVEAIHVSIPELTFEHTKQLLNYQAEVAGAAILRRARDNDLQKVYAAVGGHPLALRLIPRLAKIYSLSEIIQGWQLGQPDHIARLYRSIYDDLWETLLPVEKQLMNVMPFVSLGGGTREYLQAIAGLSREMLWPILTKLVESCLIEPHGNLYERKYGIHRLTEQYITNRWRAKGGETRTNQAIINALAFWQQHLQPLADKEWYLFDNEQENLARVLRFSLNLPEEKITSELQAIWQGLFDLLFRYIEQRGYAAQWLPLLQAITEKFDKTISVYGYLLNRTGEIHRLNHQVTEAMNLHQKALKIAQQIKDGREIARAHFNLGNAHLRNRAYKKALAHGNLAIKHFEQLQVAGKDRAAALNMLGMAAFMQGQLPLSASLLREAAKIWRDLRFDPELARTLRNLAWVLQKQQEPALAASCFQEARQALSKTASELDRTLIYLAEGSFYFEQKQYQKAETIFQQIDMSYLEKSGHTYYQAYALNNLGNMAYVRGKYAEAEQLLRESIRKWQHLSEPLEMANSLGRLGDVLVDMGKSKEAKEVYTEAQNLLEKYDTELRMVNLKEELSEALARLTAVKETKNGGNHIL